MGIHCVPAHIQEACNDFELAAQSYRLDSGNTTKEERDKAHSHFKTVAQNYINSGHPGIKAVKQFVDLSEEREATKDCLAIYG